MSAVAARMLPAPINALVRDADVPGAPYTLTSEGLDFIEKLAGSGASDMAIATALKIDRGTFRLMRERNPEVDERLARGRSVLDYELTHVLLSAARKGYWLAARELGRSRLGWKDGDRAGPRGVEDQPAPPPGAKLFDLRSAIGVLDAKGVEALGVVLEQLARADAGKPDPDPAPATTAQEDDARLLAVRKPDPWPGFPKGPQ